MRRILFVNPHGIAEDNTNRLKVTTVEQYRNTDKMPI